MSQKLESLSDRELLEKIYESVEKTRLYFLWMIIGSVLLFLLPLLGLIFVIPMLLNTYSQLGSLGL